MLQACGHDPRFRVILFTVDESVYSRELAPLAGAYPSVLIGASALRVFISHGPFGQPPAAWVFDRKLDEGEWERALGHQTQLHVSAREAMVAVREAWLDAAQ